MSAPKPETNVFSPGPVHLRAFRDASEYWEIGFRLGFGASFGAVTALGVMLLFGKLLKAMLA